MRRRIPQIDHISGAVITASLVLLWVYSGTSKLLEQEPDRLQMLNQVLPAVISQLLIALVSIIELAAAGLLCFNRTRRIGLILSVLLLTIFSVYIGLVVFDAFRYTPCSCGGIIAKLSWEQHLVFNLFFLALALYGVFINLRKEVPQEGL